MEEKSREEVLAERKLRKAAKQAKKKGPAKTPNESQPIDNTEVDCAVVNFDKLKISGPANATKGDVPRADSKTDSKKSSALATNEVGPAKPQKSDTVKEQTSTSLKAEKIAEQKNTNNNSDGGKSKAELRAERRAKQVFYLSIMHPSLKGTAERAEVPFTSS